MPLSSYRTGTYINRVYKKYNVIDDIAELIDKKVHNDRMKIICWVIENVFGKTKNLLVNTGYAFTDFANPTAMDIFKEKAFVSKNKKQFHRTLFDCEWYNLKTRNSFPNEYRRILYTNEAEQIVSDRNEYPNYMLFGSYEGKGKNKEHISSIKRLIAIDKKHTDFQHTNMFKMKKGFKIAEMVDIFIKNKIPFTTKFNKKMFIEKWFKWVPEDKKSK